MDHETLDRILTLKTGLAESARKLAEANEQLALLQHSVWALSFVARKAKDSIDRALYHLKNDEPTKAANELNALSDLLEPEKTQARTYTMTEPPPPYPPSRHE